MIAMAIDTFSTITKTQSKLHHSRACRESAALDMKTLRVMTKKTKENKSSEIQLQWESSAFKLLFGMDGLLIKTAETDTFLDVRVVARTGGNINSGTEKDCDLATFSLTSASYLLIFK